jgi:hypothetical protein
MALIPQFKNGSGSFGLLISNHFLMPLSYSFVTRAAVPRRPLFDTDKQFGNSQEVEVQKIVGAEANKVLL